jgi:class 3 adenylate cyclase
VGGGGGGGGGVGGVEELLEPARRPTAVLFADIQASSRLARHISTAGYFELIRGFTTAVDEIVIRHSGIVGRHAGDGVTAFFLADQVGGTAAACAAALRAGCEIVGWRPEDRRLDYEEFVVNAGAHWGGALYLGQIVTGGRLEITALGDEVNECARMEQAARDGAILASKALIERLSAEDAAAVGIDPEHVLYQSLAELPGADEKTIRDAGTLAVTDIAKAEREEP